MKICQILIKPSKSQVICPHYFELCPGMWVCALVTTNSLLDSSTTSTFFHDLFGLILYLSVKFVIGLWNWKLKINKNYSKNYSTILQKAIKAVYFDSLDCCYRILLLIVLFHWHLRKPSLISRSFTNNFVDPLRSQTVWPVKSSQMSIKVAQKLFH